MIKTYGLTHVALTVKSAKRSFEFYEEVFGVKKVYDQGTSFRRKRRAHATFWFSTKKQNELENGAGSNILVFDCNGRKMSILPRS